jgi:hypothetical protein
MTNMAFTEINYEEHGSVLLETGNNLNVWSAHNYLYSRARFKSENFKYKL